MTLCPPIAVMGEEVEAFAGRDVRENGGDRAVDGIAGSAGSLAQPMLEFGEEHLDGVEVRGVLGQEEEPGAGGPDGTAHRFGAVRTQIVHDDDVAWLERGNEDLFDIEQETLSVDRSLDQPWCDDPIVTQAGDKGHGFPTAPWNLGQQALTAGGPTAKGGHVGPGPSLVDEDKARGINATLIGPPLRPPASHVGPILLLGDQRLFL